MTYSGTRPSNKAFDFTWTKLTTDVYRANIPTAAAVLMARNAKVLQSRSCDPLPIRAVVRVPRLRALVSNYPIFTLVRSRADDIVPPRSSKELNCDARRDNLSRAPRISENRDARNDVRKIVINVITRDAPPTRYPRHYRERKSFENERERFACELIWTRARGHYRHRATELKIGSS